MGKGQDLYKKAKQMIPGGTMLLSKRPEQLLPENWPSYFSKSKGCEVWDLDGNHYYDCFLMGVGTNTLGYANDEVDEAVMKVVKDGNLTTFNCPEEVYLAERMIELNPWASGVRYTRGGGEANAVCVRIARAFSGKDKVAICGYHGWHDWYVSVNLGESDALAGHLLPGIPTDGVPRGLRGTSIPFHYNNFDELLDIVNKNPDLAAIKMEVCRNFGPEDNFLQKVRNLATERGIVLISMNVRVDSVKLSVAYILNTVLNRIWPFSVRRWVMVMVSVQLSEERISWKLRKVHGLAVHSGRNASARLLHWQL